jgi:hypothetical protein
MTEARPASGTSGGTVVIVTAPPETIPAGATLRATNLDDSAAPVDAIAGSDGAFALELRGNVGDELRLQVIGAGGRRSSPVDVVVVDGAQPTAATRPLTACLRFDPEGWSSIRGSLPLSVENGCEAEVGVEAVRLRDPSDPIAIEPMPPLAIPAGTSIAIELAMTGPLLGGEAVVIVDITGPESGRRPLTLVSEEASP